MESDRLSNTLSDGTRDDQQRGRPLHGRTSGPTRRSTKGQWTAEEDEILRMAVQRFKGKNWKKIAECFKDRTDVQCLHRWQKVLNPDLVKGPWSKEEDEIIIKMVDKYGPKKWSTIAQHLPGRIGKQCRERWHNHLNPNINKEAWTQEEELALIRAHQVYGNKWAELTKFLPGRTDNSIKNHWNSSVKKKLDMYLASGLLSQFQGPPFVSHVHQSAATSSSKVQQNSEDDSILKEKTEMEEASECSQGSTINRTAHPIVDCSVNEELGPFPCSEDYRPVFQEDTFGCEASENFLEHELLLDWGNFAGKHWEFNSNELPDMSLLDLGQESSDPFMPSLNGTDSHGTEPILPETSMALVPFTCRIDMVVSNNTPNLAADSDNILLYPETGHDGYLPSENMSTQINGPTDSLFQSNYQTLEDRNFVSQSFYMPSDMLENSFTQPCSIPTQLRFNDCQGMFSQNTIQGHYPSLDNVEQESNPPNTHEGFISDSIPCEDNSNEANGSPKREANDFFLAPSNNSQCDTSKGKDTVQTGEQDPGSISYNPPRFPSLDIPFFSCDLIQSGTDMHQDYSPLGIRQLMISSSMTPFKLWDSPSRDDSSPDAVLRSAAKTFTGTPSILKKRCRDLVSPLSEKRGEKKKETSNLRNDSRLGALFDECVDVKEFTVSSNPNTEEEFEVGCSDKENVGPGHTKGVKNERGKGEMENEHEFSGILLEHDMNDLIFISPDRFGIKNDRATGLSARALGNRYSKRLEAASKNGAIFSAAETSCFSVVCSPRLSNKKDVTNLVITNTSSLQSLSPSAKKVESSGNGAASENNSIFVDTPFRRSMESPSAWKSPWLFNTFVPGPRVDTEITIEDIGYLLSPGERSYDAIGLMKQLGEQTARAFADAQEVLGDETPDTIMKTQNPNSSADLQNLLSSQIMTERRTLDFSECGTPVKQTEKISSSSGHSSPSYFVSAEELQIERGI